MWEVREQNRSVFSQFHLHQGEVPEVRNGDEARAKRAWKAGDKVINFCKDCKWGATDPAMKIPWYTCSHKNACDPVDGTCTDCSHQRSHVDALYDNQFCGPLGQWFEAKETTK